MDKGNSSCNDFKMNKRSSVLAFAKCTERIPLAKFNATIATEALISPESLNHSNKGEFTSSSKKHISGGHGQDNIDYMDKNGIKYEINRIYNNGVRVGNILNSADRKMRSGNNHSWFPKDWSEFDIKNAANNILKKYKYPKNGKFSGTFKNVKVTIILKDGKIKTIYPNKYQRGGKKKWLINKWR